MRGRVDTQPPDILPTSTVTVMGVVDIMGTGSTADPLVGRDPITGLEWLRILAGVWRPAADTMTLEGVELVAVEDSTGVTTDLENSYAGPSSKLLWLLDRVTGE